LNRLVVFISACLFAGVCAAQPPHKVSLSYDISYNGIVAAELIEVLEHDGKSFSLRSEGRGKGIGALLYHGAARRWCRGELTGAGLRPLEYREQRGDRPPAVARFDWVGKTLTQERGRGLTRFEYVVAGPEQLKTPAGELQTVRLVKQRENKDDKETEIWFASGRDYLPVRILVVDKDGTRIDQVLTRVED